MVGIGRDSHIPALTEETTLPSSGQITPKPVAHLYINYRVAVPDAVHIQHGPCSLWHALILSVAVIRGTRVSSCRRSLPVCRWQRNPLLPLKGSPEGPVFSRPGGPFPKQMVLG